MPLGSGLSGGFDPAFHALAAWNGSLFAGGEFTIAGDTSSYYIAPWLEGNPASTPSADGSPLNPNLAQNYRNPFSGTTALPYFLSAVIGVRLTIHDVTGRRIATLVDQTEACGQHLAAWDGRGGAAPIAPGVYIARLETGETRQTRKTPVVGR